MNRDDFASNLSARYAAGRRWRFVFMAATVVSVLFLVSLIASVVNMSFGYVLTVPEVHPRELERDGVPLVDQDEAALLETLRENLSRRLFARLDGERPLAGRNRSELYGLVIDEVVDPTVVRTWSLVRSLSDRPAILRYKEEEHPDGTLAFMSWIRPALFSLPQSSVAMKAGIRGAIIGSLGTVILTILVAFPVGVAAAVYLEEYAKKNAFTRIVETNIYNLAGVPSIIYGMLGLAIFVRGLEPVTSGAVFGVGGPAGAGGGVGANGRTILSASLTLAVLILPIVIINAQEALRGVPQTLRQSSLAVGATRWQTVWHHVLPASLDRIMTGTVLAVSRALGETAPLVVVGASTFLSRDPTGPFSKFTTLPIQIYQWTSRPQGEFRNLAAAAILVLLVLGLTLNASAIIVRSGYRNERKLGR